VRSAVLPLEEPLVNSGKRRNLIWSGARVLLGTAYLFFLFLPLLALAAVALAAEAQVIFPPSQLSLRWLRQVLDDPSWRTTFAVSARVGGIAVVLDVLTAVPVAWWFWRRSFRGFGVPAALFCAPLVVPVVAYGFAAYALWLRVGIADSVFGIALAHACLGFPAVLLTLCAGLARLEPQLEEVAWTLGAARFLAFFSITLPRLVPSLLAAAAIGFLLSLDESVVVQFISGPRVLTVPRRLWEGIRFDLDPSIAAVALLWMGTTVLLTALGAMASRRLFAVGNQSRAH
jgi:putative spermidine/putrescine transport system permease protein